MKRCRSAVADRDGTGGIYEHPEGRSPWGLFAMSGNAEEWCQDWYEAAAVYARYKAGDVAPQLTGEELRVARGGGWYQGEFDWMVRTSQRYGIHPNNRRSDVGFRVAMTP